MVLTACSSKDDAGATGTEFETVSSIEESKEEFTQAGTIKYEQVESVDDGKLDKNGSYNSAEDVARYLHEYNQLPSNYITKEEAKKLGWVDGSVEKFAPGKSIGGDYFPNDQAVLPIGETYYECDVDTTGKYTRGAKRLVYTREGKIYYTEDYYESFVQLY